MSLSTPNKSIWKPLYVIHVCMQVGCGCLANIGGDDEVISVDLWEQGKQPALAAERFPDDDFFQVRRPFVGWFSACIKLALSWYAYDFLDIRLCSLEKG